MSRRTSRALPSTAPPPRSGPSPRWLTAASTPASRRSARGGTAWRKPDWTRPPRLIKDAGLRVSSLCRGGFLTAADAEGQAAALADNRAAILEAVALDTRELFLVVGGLAPGEKDVVAARRRVADRLADLVPFAGENGVRLVLEPLHPMYAADRALISTLGQALDLAAPFDASSCWRRRRHLPRLVGSGAEGADRTRRPGEPHRLLPGVRLQHAHRRGSAAVPRIHGRRRH